MQLEIQAEYPLWLVFFCILLGVCYAFALYIRDKKLNVGNFLMALMATMRALAVSLLAFLLLGPFIKQLFKKVEKPLIIFVQDNSASILSGNDSSFAFEQYPEQVTDFLDGLADKHEVKSYLFGESLSEGLQVTYTDQVTDFSGMFHQLESRFVNRNIGALIISSDGIMNRGIDPVYASEAIDYPIYTLALGDTVQKRDLLIEDVNYNKIAFAGNEFPVEIIARAEKCGGERVSINITKQGKTLQQKNITITGDKQLITHKVILKAEGKGIQHYQVRLGAIDQEISTVNNIFDVFIDVIGSKKKVLILAHAPHPDIAAIKSALKGNNNIEVVTAMEDGLTYPPEDFDLVILHQVPSIRGGSVRLMKKFKELRMPQLYILGPQSDLQLFNELESGIVVYGNNETYLDAFPLLNKSFNYFTLSEELKEILPQWPPLFVPFGTYRQTASSQSLAYQRLGNQTTDYPMITLISDVDFKKAVISGEGIWRWRLYNFKLKSEHLAFDQMIRQIVQFLSVNKSRDFFNINQAGGFLENERVVFDAEVYNESYELINHPEVSLVISDQEGRQYPFVFNTSGNKYFLDAGNFAPGSYSYKGEVKHAGHTYVVDGEFIVKRLNFESNVTAANHNMLYRLAKSHNGEMVFPGQLGELKELINDREDIFSVSYYNKEFTELIHVSWILIVLLGLLTLEWFIRKYSGTY